MDDYAHQKAWQDAFDRYLAKQAEAAVPVPAGVLHGAAKILMRIEPEHLSAVEFDAVTEVVAVSTQTLFEEDRRRAADLRESLAWWSGRMIPELWKAVSEAIPPWTEGLNIPLEIELWHRFNEGEPGNPMGFPE